MSLRLYKVEVEALARSGDDRWLMRELSSDLAGETGAVAIYAGYVLQPASYSLPRTKCFCRLEGIYLIYPVHF